MKGIKIIFDNGDKLFIRCETADDVVYLIEKIAKCINKKKAVTIYNCLTINTKTIRFVAAADELACYKDNEENKVFEEY